MSGRASTLAGGMTSAGIGFSLQYSKINQPQTISAPANVHPYSEFATKLRSLLSGVTGSVAGAGCERVGLSGLDWRRRQRQEVHPVPSVGRPGRR